MVPIKVKNIVLVNIMLSGKNHDVSYLANCLSETFLVKMEHRTSLANKISKDFSYTFKKNGLTLPEQKSVFQLKMISGLRLPSPRVLNVCVHTQVKKSVYVYAM